MRIRKIIGMLAVGMLSLSLLAGCGSTKEENPKEQKPQTKKQETADTGTKEKIMAEIKVKDYGTITGKELAPYYFCNDLNQFFINLSIYEYLEPKLEAMFPNGIKLSKTTSRANQI